jgi:hypothetical protein
MRPVFLLIEDACRVSCLCAKEKSSGTELRRLCVGALRFYVCRSCASVTNATFLSGVESSQRNNGWQGILGSEGVAPEHQFSTDNPRQGRNAAMRFFILIASVCASVSGGPHAGCQFPRHSIHFQQHPHRRCAYECNHNGSGAFPSRRSRINPQLVRHALGFIGLSCYRAKESSPCPETNRLARIPVVIKAHYDDETRVSDEVCHRRLRSCAISSQRVKRWSILPRALASAV